MVKYILPVLAIAGTALAQCDGPLTITTSADATAISNCSKFNGDVIISSSATGTIAINGVKQITGDLSCSNATMLNSITSDQLNSIGGYFRLNGLTTLTNLQMNSLSAVNRINWVTLPQLQTLNFAQGVSQANQVYISDTQLSSLSGIELTQCASMDINNNPYLDTINVNSLTNVTTSLAFSANGRDLDISFPNLLAAANLTFRNVTSIEMPSLNNVLGAVGLYSDMISTFSAPNLTYIGQTLAFVDCSELTSISLPALTTIGGGFQLANNTALKKVDGLTSLVRIGGAIDFAGVFDYASLPNLTTVRGGANIHTTSTNSTLCSPFNTLHSRGVIQGSVTCVTGTSSATNTSSTGSGSSSTSHNAAPAPGFNPAAPLTGVFSLIAAMLFL